MDNPHEEEINSENETIDTGVATSDETSQLADNQASDKTEESESDLPKDTHNDPSETDSQDNTTGDEDSAFVSSTYDSPEYHPAPQTTEQDPSRPAPIRLVRDAFTNFVDQKDLPKATALLVEQTDFSDNNRALHDNLWLYLSLAEMYKAQGDAQKFVDTLLKALSFLPNDKDILLPLLELLTEFENLDAARLIANSLLLFHMDSLSNDDRRFVYTQLAFVEKKFGNLQATKDALECALLQTPNHLETLESLISVLLELKQYDKVVHLRRRLLNECNQPSQRAKVLFELGNDYLHYFHDPEQALDIFDQALSETPGNVEILNTYLAAASASEDWERVYEVLLKLAKASHKEPILSANWYFKAANVARDELWKPEQAALRYREVLRIDPTRLDAFQAITSIYVDSKNWPSLEEVYTEEIESLEALNQPQETNRIVATMWEKLGELYRIHMEREADALKAYSKATEYDPDSIELHEKVVQIAEIEAGEDQLDLAILHLRHLIRLQPENLNLLERLGKTFLKMKRLDPALCIYRALKILGYQLEQRPLSFIDKFHSPIFQNPPAKLRPPLIKRQIYTKELDSTLNPIFAALKPGLEHWVGHQASHFGLKKKNRVDISEQLIFNNIFRIIGGTFGFYDLPQIYRKSDQVGMINGGIIPDQFQLFGTIKVGGLIAGDDLLGSGREQYAAFVIAKQLFLFQSEFYLATLRPPTDLRIFLAIAQSICGQEINLPDSTEVSSAYKAIKKRLNAEELNALQLAIHKYKGESIPNWLDAIEETANRVGLLFANDLQPSIDYLQIDPQPLGSRVTRRRIQDLIQFYISDQHFETRKELGLAVA